MYRVTHLIRICKVPTMCKFYSNAAPSIMELKEMFESLNFGEVAVSKCLLKFRLIMEILTIFI